MKKIIPSLGAIVAILVFAGVMLGLIYAVPSTGISSLRNSVVCDGEGHWGYVDSIGIITVCNSASDAAARLKHEMDLMKRYHDEQSRNWKVCHE